MATRTCCYLLFTVKFDYSTRILYFRQFSVHLHHMIRQAQGLGDREEKIPSASKFFPYFLS